ncbi:MAG: hypothetical protein L0332_16725 [Chloroflexi bacterium]|nr:hypothetical protein [Chloroflexota bacterium]MCI0728345.1 hypothetical protein [Chloroflexota bacterium]
MGLGSGRPRLGLSLRVWGTPGRPPHPASRQRAIHCRPMAGVLPGDALLQEIAGHPPHPTSSQRAIHRRPAPGGEAARGNRLKSNLWQLIGWTRPFSLFTNDRLRLSWGDNCACCNYHPPHHPTGRINPLKAGR